MVALLVDTCLGASRHMSVGTTSAPSIMAAGTLGGLALADPDDYLAAAQLTTIFAGIIAVVAGLLKLGFVVKFIFESVLTGFSAGAALFTQLCRDLLQAFPPTEHHWAALIPGDFRLIDVGPADGRACWMPRPAIPRPSAR